MRGGKLVCPELSAEKLADLRELADFYNRPRERSRWNDHAATTARRTKTEQRRSSQRDCEAPSAGELNWVRTSVLHFGQDSSGRKRFRPVVAVGRERPPFYLALPQTTQRSHGRHSFRLVREDYEVNLGDENRWPKWLHCHIETVALKEKRRYLGRLRESTMTRVESWRQECSAGDRRWRRGS